MGGSFMQNEQQILLEHLAKDSDLAYIVQAILRSDGAFC